MKEKMMSGFRWVQAAAFAACLVLAGAAGLPARAAGGLAPDGDFEASPFASYYTNGSGTFTWATDQSYSWSHSLKIVSTQAPGQLARWMTNTTAIAVTPGVTYAVSAQFTTANASSGAMLAASFWNASQGYTGTTVSSKMLYGSTDWSQLRLQATAPAGAAFMRVEFRLFGPGTVWVDDLTVSIGAGSGPPVALAGPSILGVPMVGETLTANPGVWTGTQPITIHWAWNLIGPYEATPYFGDDSLAFPDDPIPQGLGGTQVCLRVAATNELGMQGRAVCEYIQPAPDEPPALTAFPQASGLARVGETLRTTTGTWLGQPQAITYRWQRCGASQSVFGGGEEACSDIAGATSATYLPTADDVGFRLAVWAIASNANGSTARFAAWPYPPIFNSGTVEAAPNLVPNPDVEARPDTYYTNGVGTFTWATDQSYSWSHSLKVVSIQAPGQLARWMSNTTAVRVTPGVRYRASAWLRTSGVEGDAKLSITFWDANRTYLGTTVDSTPALTGTRYYWTQTTAAATAPAGAAFVRVELRLFGPGTLWADDITVTRTS